MTVMFLSLPRRGITMSQNKAPRAELSKPHIYHYSTRNMGSSTFPVGLKAAIGSSLYFPITQLRRTSKNGVQGFSREPLFEGGMLYYETRSKGILEIRYTV